MPLPFPRSHALRGNAYVGALRRQESPQAKACGYRYLWTFLLVAAAFRLRYVSRKLKLAATDTSGPFSFLVPTLCVGTHTSALCADKKARKLKLAATDPSGPFSFLVPTLCVGTHTSALCADKKARKLKLAATGASAAFFW